MSKKKHKKTHDTLNKKKKRNLEYYQEHFHEFCDFCGCELSCVKHRPKNTLKGEVFSATCVNDNYKGLGVKCEMYLVEIRFRTSPWC